MISFPKFESDISEKILERGQSYFKNGYIQDVEVVDKGEFSAIVLGTEEYDVFIQLTGSEVTEQTCTCPYFEDYDNVCKHIVAVLYYIRSNEMHDDEFIVTVSQDIQDILNDTTDEELRRFVFDLAKRNRNFREDFFGEFG